MVRDTQFFGDFAGGQSIHNVVPDIIIKKTKNQVTYIVFILKGYESVSYPLLEDGNMDKIINFLEAKQALVLNRVKRQLQQEYEEKQATRPPAKKALVISALPGEALQPEYEDLRPYLQRDGLILLSWARWKNHDDYGAMFFRFNWVKSRGPLKHYAGGWWINSDMEKMKAEAYPGRRGDYEWRKGIIGNSVVTPNERNTADVVFICAPELTPLTRPFFIEQLKNSGVKVDFDFDFSLGYAKELEFKKQVELIQSLGSRGVKNA